MLEQEIASVMNFLIEATGRPKPYYRNVPEGFVVPSIFFPIPELTSSGDTMRTYKTEYSWYVKFFGKYDEDAYALGLAALNAIKSKRNLVPLIDETGSELDEGIRISDPTLRPLDDGATQLAIRWESRKPYEDGDYAAIERVIIALTLKDK